MSDTTPGMFCLSKHRLEARHAAEQTESKFLNV